MLDPKEKLDGTRPEDYGLPQNERLSEVITQSWNRLRKHWAEFRAASANLPPGEAGTGLTNDKWSLPLLRELGFGLLPTTSGPEINGRTYAINRFFGPVPMHLVGCGLSLDRRAAGVRGAAAGNPHGLVQEFLNRSPGHLWAMVSNGLHLRILRDNQALSRQSFLEFDLEAMFVGEAYSDFVILWLMAHATRFAPREGNRAETCWLEQWTKLANEQGTRALGDLRGGVERALQILGEGLTSHPKNAALRDALRTGQAPLGEFHGQLLRVVYRLIFLFVGEDRTIDGRSLLHERDDSDAADLARERYAAHYSMGRLREMAAQIKGSRHGDLWCQFHLITGALSGQALSVAAREYLALPALGSFLWDPASTAALNDAELTNHDFLETLRNLAFTRQGKVLRPVDYKNLGAEELGGVYESLLALTPQISADGHRFSFAEFAGNERKTSGSYYTPDSLVQCLLDSALDPVVEEAINGKAGAEAEKAILSLKVCDPAVGSGHFLVGAAHRLARHLARVRAQTHGESEPSPLLYQQALRDVIGRCLYGVDLNPMAAELCRVSLWLEALEPGKPLSFLDHHIRVGNSLLGTTPELIAAGIPEEAFTAIEGDDKKACAVLKKRNKAQRSQPGLLLAPQYAETQDRLEQAAAALEELPDDRPEALRVKELAFRRHEQTEEYRHKKQLADAWCAAFFMRKHFREPARENSASGITQGDLNGLADGRPLPAEVAGEVERLSSQCQFFHWHLAFPEVFAKGGFDCILGNPPWERTAFEDLEFFASKSVDVLAAPTTAARKRIIDALQETDPQLFEQYTEERRRSLGENHFFSASGRYKHGAIGRLNTYALFTDLAISLTSARGRAGIIVQTNIATDAPMEQFWRFLVESRRLISIIDFENRDRLFPTVHAEQKFCLLCVAGTGRDTSVPVKVGFWLRNVSQVNSPECVYPLSIESLHIVSPNTAQPILSRSSNDFTLACAIYRRHPILARAGDARPRARAWRALMTAGSSQHFRSRHELGGGHVEPDGSIIFDGDIYLPLIESKLIHQFDYCYATYEGVSDEDIKNGNPRSASHAADEPNMRPTPRFWAARAVVERMYSDKEWKRQWIVGTRDVTNVNNERTAIACIVPRVGILQPLNAVSCVSADDAALVVAAVNSFVVDYLARQRFTGRHLNVTTFSQLPLPEGGPESLLTLVKHVALELTYISSDLSSFAQDCGWAGRPFRWDEERRFLLRCELDAVFFHLYLGPVSEWSQLPEALTKAFPKPRDAVSYIMDTFPIVKRKDEEHYGGNYRTKRVILEIYDALVEAERTGVKYLSRLKPAPADASLAHPASCRPEISTI
ncbi:MAG: N-6 DNA methylase [bacterium]|nr:N-6 DNA methylase [bacterium]